MWLHCIVNNRGQCVRSTERSGDGSVEKAARTEDPDADVRNLFLDYRMARVHGKIASSHIIGKAASFLSWCCDSELCPFGQHWQPVAGTTPDAFEVVKECERHAAAAAVDPTSDDDGDA